MNKDASFLLKVANEVPLTPGTLTKVALMCEENTCKDLLLMNDKYRCTDVNFDNMLVNPQEGRFFAYVTSATDKSARLSPGESFCSACISENSVNESVLEQTNNNSLEKELGTVGFPENKPI